MNFVQSVKKFNEIAGTLEEFDKRKASLYLGLILEEVAEMIDSLGSADEDPESDEKFQGVSEYLDVLGNNFKSGEYDYMMNAVNRKEFLDAAVDIAVVSLGAGISIGADIEGATMEVADSNLSKFPLVEGVYTVLKDGNGKIMKPPSFRKPELSQFLK